MASARKLTDNHLTCIICTEVFTDPATLQCKHTFCKSCLLKYTKTQTEAIQAKSIPCPSCRQQTQVINPDSPVEEWINQLKPSHVIQSLMDDLGGSPVHAVYIVQCKHTFCKSCLLKYTKTQTEAIQAKSIPCPSCRQQTQVINPGSPVEQWVSQLKPSHLIESLILDDLGGSTDVDACSVCKEDGKTTPGTMWCAICEAVFCDGCLKLHKKMPLSRHHEVFDVRIHSNRKPKVRSFMCRIHKDEKIKLFCKDCRVAMCTVCCSIKHRKCDDVETIDVMMPLIKETLVNETRNQEKKIQTYTNNISLTNSKIAKLTTSAQEMKDDVRKVRMAATDVLVGKENELLDRIDKLTESRVQELKAHRKNQEDDLQVEQQRNEFIDKAVTSDCVADMFDMYESLNGASRDEDGREDQRPQTSSIIFLHDIEMLMRSVDDVMQGEVIVGSGLSDRTSTPVLLETIVFSRDRIGLIDLSDVLVCAVDGIRVITVVDYLNCRLSTQYVQNKTSLKKHLQLPSGPGGIAKVGGTKGAVTLPDTQEIAFIEFDPEPTLQSNVKTKRKYRGLAFLNPAQLVAGRFDGPTSVDLLDMGGNVLKSISTGVIGNPRYIHVTRKNNVVVSEASVTSLISVTIDGQAVFTFTPRGDRALEYPCGITTTSTGDILLVVRHSLKVIQLTESGQFVRDVLTPCDDLWYPTGICLDDDGLLYVTSGGYVKVFGCE